MLSPAEGNKYQSEMSLFPHLYNMKELPCVVLRQNNIRLKFPKLLASYKAQNKTLLCEVGVGKCQYRKVLPAVWCRDQVGGCE